MVSALNLTRMLSAQYALRSFSGATQNSDLASQSSKINTLLRNLNVDTSSPSKCKLQNTLDQLLHQGGSTKPGSAPEQSDVTNADFMKNFKKQLEDAAKKEGASGSAHDMLTALKAGTLTITDPVRGVSLQAWDVDAEGMKDVESKPGTQIKPSSWSDFLTNHLKRESNATFSKEHGNFVDKSGRQYAGFGELGGTKYYLTWPKPNAAPVDT